MSGKFFFLQKACETLKICRHGRRDNISLHNKNLSLLRKRVCVWLSLKTSFSHDMHMSASRSEFIAVSAKWSVLSSLPISSTVSTSRSLPWFGISAEKAGHAPLSTWLETSKLNKLLLISPLTGNGYSESFFTRGEKCVLDLSTWRRGDDNDWGHINNNRSIMYRLLSIIHVLVSSSLWWTKETNFAYNLALQIQQSAKFQQHFKYLSSSR